MASQPTLAFNNNNFLALVLQLNGRVRANTAPTNDCNIGLNNTFPLVEAGIQIVCLARRVWGGNCEGEDSRRNSGDRQKGTHNK
jgi:hypothetical protein